MKYLWHFFLCVGYIQAIAAEGYINSLDSIIQEKIKALKQSYFKVHHIDEIVPMLHAHTENKLSNSKQKSFLNPTTSIVGFFHDQVTLSINDVTLSGARETLENFTALKIAINAKLYLCFLDCCQEQMLKQAAKNDEALRYWKNEHFTENLVFYKKNILRWPYLSSYQNRIACNIDRIQDLSNKTYAFLGLLSENKHMLLQSMFQDDFHQKLIQAMRLQTDFLQNIEDNLVYNNFMYEDYDFIVKNSLEQAYNFNLYIKDLYSQCQLPLHIVRHWKEYTMSIAALYGCAYMYCNYHQSMIDKAEYFWHEHARGPVEKALQSFTGVVSGPQLKIEENEKTAEAIIDKEMSKPMPRTSGDGNTFFTSLLQDLNESTDYSLEQIYDEAREVVPANPTTWRFDVLWTPIETQVNKLLAAGKEKLQLYAQRAQPIPDYSGLSFDEKKELVLPRITTILANKEKNLTRLPDAYSLKLELESIEAKQALNEILKGTHVALCLIALIPTVSVIGGSLFASKNIYNSVTYKPLRKLVRQLDVLLTQALQDKNVYIQQGHLLFLLHQLFYVVDVLTIEEQKMMQEDLAQLYNHDLDYVQKYNVVQRMYKTYPCLMTSGI